jgi:putative phosphoribosyl transferase
VSVVAPQNFYGVGQWYEDFSQTTDEEVCRLLAELRQPESVAV